MFSIYFSITLLIWSKCQVWQKELFFDRVACKAATSFGQDLADHMLVKKDVLSTASGSFLICY